MRIVINGARGRMGRMVVEAAAGCPDVEVAGLLERPGHPDAGWQVGTAAGPMAVATDPASVTGPVDVGIDFSTPDSAVAFARAMAARGAAVLCGTTGLGEQHLAALEEVGRDVAVLWTPNTSIGVHCLHELAARATAMLGSGYDVEVVELHHRHKRDAPSGTALSLARRVSEAAGGGEVVVSRDGQCGPRPQGEIGVLAIRGGEVVGEHTVLFLGDHDRIEITHRASSREALANGAIALARRLVGRHPGMCRVGEVL